MSFSIPELQGYFGGKGGSGTYQNIINLIPPHDVFVVPFLGHCAIIRNKKFAALTYASDIDPFVIDSWTNYAKKYKDGYLIDGAYFQFVNSGWEYWNCIKDSGNHFFYFDPPYPHSTRKSNHRYKFEMTDDYHITLLKKAKSYKKANVMISSYKNPLYDEHLEGWNTHSFPSMTRNGIAIETVYYNYDTPDKLHDYSYFGKNYKNREHFKLKRERLVNRFLKMTAVEQNFYMEALNEVVTK